MLVTVETFTQIIGQYLPEPHAGLLAGIAYGTKMTMSRDLVTALTRTGTLHIVALSGMNISIVAGLVSLTLLRFVSRRIASLLTVLIIIGFVWFVGPTASVVRAAIMGCIALLAVILGRNNWSLFSWILAVVVMLAVNPSWIGDLSFQLSALATLGIILFGGKSETSDALRGSPFAVHPSNPSSRFPSSNSIEDMTVLEKVHRAASLDKIYFAVSPQRGFLTINKIMITVCRWFWRLIEDDLRVTLAAQVFTIPIILLNFRRLSLISPIPNILIGWTIGPLTILGWLTGFAGMLFDPVGQALAWVAWVPLQFVIWTIETTSRLPFASIGF